MKITAEKVFAFIESKKQQFKQFIMSEIKLEQMKLQDGQTVIEADAFEVGQPVFVVNGEEKFPLPLGDYVLEDGRLLVISQEGMIGEIKDSTPDEAQAEQQEMESEVKPNEQQAPSAKKTVESVVKETYFSAEDYETLKAEKIALKAELETLKAEKTIELKEEIEPGVKPITHNPEPKETPIRLGSESLVDFLNNKKQ